MLPLPFFIPFQIHPALERIHPGNAIVFHDRLLHGDAVNQGQYTYISLAFTMFVKKGILCMNRVTTVEFGLGPTVHRFAALISGAVMTNLAQKKIPLEEGMEQMIHVLRRCREEEGTVYIVGNGGSAAIASHAVIDFLNMVKVRATALLDMAVITCLSNDYGYEQVYEKQLSQFVRVGDVLIAISSSGQSKNILNAVSAAKSRGAQTITLSGFGSDNPLRTVGDFNLWLDAQDYGQVEIGHAYVLHNITDRLKQ